MQHYGRKFKCPKVIKASVPVLTAIIPGWLCMVGIVCVL